MLDMEIWLYLHNSSLDWLFMQICPNVWLYLKFPYLEMRIENLNPTYRSEIAGSFVISRYDIWYRHFTLNLMPSKSIELYPVYM